MCPCGFIIFYPVAFIERGVVGYLFALVEFTFGNGVLVGLACFKVTYSFPNGAVYANANQASATGKYDISALVVPGIVFVLLEYRKLYIVNQN